MSKFELSISADYVSHWGIVEAAREFFQNALDEQVEDPDNLMFFDYIPEEEKLLIGNSNSILDAQTLLFGKTSKADNPKLIGRFGEGYKMATIVFLRNGKEVTFYNYASREIWTTKLVKSRKYKGALVPTFYVNKVAVWDKVPEESLIIEIKGITAEEYSQIKESNLHLQDEGVGELYSTSRGRILMDPEYKGKVYVSGLYVCSNDKLEYGYDFLPEYITLDRDRRVIPDFDLTWSTSKMWTEVNVIGKSLSYISDTFDGSYTSSFLYGELADVVAREFLSEYGLDAVPVSSQDEATRMRKLGYNPILVTENRKKVILGASTFKDNTTIVIKNLYERLLDFIESINDRLDEDEKSEIQDILSKSRWLLS